LTVDEKAERLGALAKALADSDDAELHREVLRGMADALAGRRDVKAPAGWSAVYKKLSASKDARTRETTLALSGQFGAPEAMAARRKTVEDPKATRTSRARALEVLLDKRAEGTPALLRKLLDDGALRRAAVRGLARYEEKDTPAMLLNRYDKFDHDTKVDAVN